MQYRLLIIGGGASGLAAAVTAAQCGADGVALLERLPRPGKKILATGNGRCNLSHAGIVPGDYAGSFDVSQILANFGDAVAFFEGLGLLCRTDGEGRIYPYSMTAAAVLDALRMQLGGTSLLTDSQVTGLRPISGGWRVETETASYTAARVIFAAGGHAAPKHGTDGTAWAMLDALGIPLVPPRPILCPLRSEAKLLRPLKGLRVRADVTLLDRGKAVRTESGEVQFTETALSGICLFNMAAHVDPSRIGDFSVRICVLPGHDPAAVLYALQATRAGQTAEDMLTGIIQRPLARHVLKTTQIRTDLPCEQLGYHEMQRLGDVLSGMVFPVTGLAGFDQAQATAGGVRGDALDDHLQVRSYPGLYVTGEAVDVHGPCGGWQLHWCWASGTAAAHHALGI